MDMGTPDVDIGTSVEDATTRMPNSVILDLRKSQGWGRPRLASELHKFCLAKGWPSPGEANIAKQIYRLETGRIKNPDEFYKNLYAQFYQKSAYDLFGDIESQIDTSATYLLRSHKFIPLYIGPAAAEQFSISVGAAPSKDQWTECNHANISRDEKPCDLYIWPFGVIIYHLVEELSLKSVAELSIWRRSSYPENMAWAESQVVNLLGRGAQVEPYVLSAYWVESTPLNGSRLDTALRLLCIPRVLIDRDDQCIPSQAHAELVEQALLKEGFDHPEIEDFGIKGISAALASWSGVVYHPLAPSRALTEDEIVRCELSMQAVWSYCNYIRAEVERGCDPDVSGLYSWRFLRGLQSRLTMERPQETSQHRSMREAIVKTSGLSRHLAQAVETLRDTSEGTK